MRSGLKRGKVRKKQPNTMKSELGLGRFPVPKKCKDGKRRQENWRGI